MQRKQPLQKPLCMCACVCTCVHRHVHCVHAHTFLEPDCSQASMLTCSDKHAGLVSLPAHTQTRDH